MSRKLLFIVLFLTALAAAHVASAQFTIKPYSREITGTVSGTDGTRVFLLDNRLTIDVSNASIRSDAGPASIADLTPGTRIFAGVHSSIWMGAFTAVEVEILSDYDATLRGLIDHIDFAGGTFSIVGHTVRFTPSTEVRRTTDGALVPVTDLRPMMNVLVAFDRDEPGLAAEKVYFEPMAQTNVTTGGRVSAINGNLWTIGGGPNSTTVRVTDDTFIAGNPQVGDRVQVTYRGDAAGDLVAVSILRISYIGEEDVAGEVRAISPQTITIDRGQGATTVHLSDSTVYRDGQPQVGDLVVVRTDGNTAAEVEKIYASDFTFSFGGDVTSIQGNEWTVQGVTFSVTPNTHITGSPQVGDRVDVYAMSVNDRWYAMTIDKL